jgi:hypothetical protein
MTDLIEKLEAATEGSRELDAAIHRLVVPKPMYAIDGWPGAEALDYTTSIDAALTLVPEGFAYTIHKEPPNTHSYIRLWNPFKRGHQQTAVGSNTALAICIASLKAIKQGEG